MQCFSEDQEVKKLLLGCLDKILLLAVNGLDPSDNAEAELKVCLECGEAISEKLQDKARQKMVECLSKTITMAGCFFALSGVAAEVSAKTIGVGALDLVLALQRACMQVQTCLSQLEAGSLEAFGQLCAACRDTCAQRVTSLRAMTLQWVLADLETKFKDLRGLHSQMSETYWLDEWKGKSFEDLQAYVESTALKLDGAELLTKSISLHQARCHVSTSCYTPPLVSVSLY